MGRHCSSERTPEAAYFAIRSEFFDQKLKNRLTVMVTRIWIWLAFGPAVISVIPRENVYLIGDEKL